MPWVRFTAAFDWRHPAFRGHSVTAYKRGMVALVSQACADKALNSNKAVAATRPQGKKLQQGERSPC